MESFIKDKRAGGTGKRKLAAADVFIILLAVLCVVGVGVRVAVGSGGIFSADEKGQYLVSYIVTGAKSDFSDYFADGTVFCLDDGTAFGTLTGGSVYTPAKTYSENVRGEYIAAYSTDGSVDIKGTVLVTGSMTDSGFLLDGSKYIAPNMTLPVSSTGISVEMLITDITKAQ